MFDIGRRGEMSRLVENNKLEVRGVLSPVKKPFSSWHSKITKYIRPKNNIWVPRNGKWLHPNREQIIKFVVRTNPHRSMDRYASRSACCVWVSWAGTASSGSIQDRGRWLRSTLKIAGVRGCQRVGDGGVCGFPPPIRRSIRCAIPPSLIGQGWSDHCYPDGGAAVPDTGAHIWPAGSFDHECRNAVPCPRERPRCVF